MPAAASMPSSGLKPLKMLVQETWDRFTKRWKFYVLYTLVSMILPGIVFMVGGALGAALGLGGLFAGGKSAFGGAMILGGLVMLVAYIAAIYVSILFSVGLMLAIMDEKLSDIKAAVMAAKPKAASAFIISIIVGLLVMVGMILFVIPGVYLAVCYAFALWVFLAEGKTGMDALKGSKELVSGRWLAVFGRLFGMGVVVWLAVVLPITILSAIKLGFLAVIYQIAASIALGPIFAIFLYVLYQNVKEAKMKGPSVA